MDIKDLSASVADFYQKKKAAIDKGRVLLDLSMINPDLPPPRVVQDRLIEAINQPGSQRYSTARGVYKLRESFALLYRNRFGVELNTDSQICITNGCKDSIILALKVICKPGDTALLGAPTYPAHRYAVEYVGGNCEFFAVAENLASMLNDIEAKICQFKPKVLLLNFPHNPTGVIVDELFYLELAKCLRRYNVILINDFVYGEMTFKEAVGCSALTIIENKCQVLETYSLSKAYSIPGWRIAGLLGSSHLVSAVAQLKSRIDFGVYLPFQFAVASALQSSESLVSPTVETYNRRALIFSDLLAKSGFDVATPTSGCCVWAKVPNFCDIAGDEFASLLLDKGVASLPGSVFSSECSRFLRFAMVRDESVLREAAEVINLIL
jgi:alanine-synthesizing transaminase